MAVVADPFCNLFYPLPRNPVCGLDPTRHDRQRFVRRKTLGRVIWHFCPYLAIVDQLDAAPLDDMKIAARGPDNDKGGPPGMRFKSKCNSHILNL